MDQDGTKFGKTAGGAVWLDPALTSPYALYQFWLNSDARDVVKFLKIFSFRDRDEIEALEKSLSERPAAREAQRALAEDFTTLLHGAEECAAVIAASRALFGQGSLIELPEHTLAAALAEIPHAAVPSLGAPLIDLLVQCGLADSKSAARRAIKEGGAYVNNIKITDEAHTPTSDDLIHARYLVLRRGKRSTAAIQVTPAA
jgi:tyrosyl-tRNA synthetase